MRKLPILLLAFALLAPALSWAGITFQLGNNPQPNEENVLLNNGTTGNTVLGVTNQSGSIVDFFSPTQLLTEPANGQARIEATSNGSQVSLMDLSFFVTGGTFEDAIFDMHIGGTIGTSGGTADITAVANDGTFHFQETLGNGGNFLTVFATGGEVLESIGISYPTGFTDLRQIRISGATVGSVPESGKTALLLGSSVTALALLRRRRAIS